VCHRPNGELDGSGLWMGSVDPQLRLRRWPLAGRGVIVRHVPADPHAAAYGLAFQRDDVLLSREASSLGLSKWDLHTLREGGELPLPRGALALPPVRNPLRAQARALQLLIPDAVISHMTAARLHRLAGLNFWEPTELLHATRAPAATRRQRRSMRLHFQSMQAEDVVDLDGLLVTSVRRTLLDCGSQLARVPFVCLLDSALNKRLCSAEDAGLLADALRGRRRVASTWVDLADCRSESPSETRVRIVLRDADLPPDDLQIEVWTEGGFYVARLDMGYIRKRRKVGLEVDSAWHDRPRAPYRDREKLNALRELDWDVRQVTDWDSRRRPSYIVAQINQALGLR
jgi:hypothetical protein